MDILGDNLMTEPVLLGLSGALRADSTNRKLLREAARLFGPCSFAEADLRLPLYDGDDEAKQGVPDVVQALAAQIAGADAIVVSTPEYNKGPSGVLKNALDWVSRVKENPWKGKPVAIVSATAGRTCLRHELMNRKSSISSDPGRSNAT